MADIVNLNRYRKQRMQAEREQAAGENRALFGRTKAERTRDENNAERIRRLIDNARLQRDDDEPA
jgi:hypothetical protein